MLDYHDLPREVRRRIKRKAPEIGRALAAGSRYSTTDGRILFINDPTALRALSRGYAACVRNAFRPVVVEMSAREGKALHPVAGRQAPADARWWLAIGTDVEGRGTHATTWTAIHGLPETEMREMAENYAFECLGRAANVAGLPVEGA